MFPPWDKEFRSKMHPDYCRNNKKYTAKHGDLGHDIK